MTLEAPLLGVAIDGLGRHPARWRTGAAAPSALLDARRLTELARLADGAGFDVLTFDDGFGPGPDRPDGAIGADALLSLARLAPLTKHVALLPTVTVTHTEPFHVSKNLATLDHVSGGRAGWHVDVSRTHEATALFGRRDVGSPGDWFEEAAAVVDAVRKLWDSWEDDAVIRDVATGRYVDRDRLHTVDVSNRFFSVRGPSITPRPPQGQPIVAVTVTGPDDPWIDVAVGHADLVVLEVRDLDAASLLRRRIIRGAANLGRSSQSVRAVLSVDVLLDHDEFAARRLRHELDRVVEPERGRRADVVGTPTQVATFVARAHAAGLDGVFFRPARLPEDLALLATDVVPLVPRAHPSIATFRDRLGLERPANRYAPAEEAAS